MSKTDQIAKELNNLYEIAKLKPQAAYSCFVNGFKHTLKYIMRTIQKTKIEELKKELNPNQLHLMKLTQQQTASSGLTFLPFKGGYIVNKEYFYLIRIRYGWQLVRLPSKCECGSTFSNDHALSCKKGGLVSLRHNQVRNLTASLLDEVCHNACVEPQVLQLTGKNLNEEVAVRSYEA